MTTKNRKWRVEFEGWTVVYEDDHIHSASEAADRVSSWLKEEGYDVLIKDDGVEELPIDP